MSAGLPAVLRLTNVGVIDASELEQSTLAVHLTSDPKMRSAWPSEIVMLGDGPLHTNEARPVALRIEAKAFSDYVSSWKPELYVCRNHEIIGYLRLK